MQKIGARWCNGYAESHWAFLGLLLAVELSVFGCRDGTSPASPSSSQEVCHDAFSSMEHEFGNAEYRCSVVGNPSDLPILYAHFIAHAVEEELCTEDPPNTEAGAITCAPGLAALDNGSSIDSGIRDWLLPALPDYFAWRLSGPASSDEMIYIANANGVPVKSQSIKLENEHDATLVLFPKASLSPGTRYYIYLVRTSPNAKTERWIQPIMMSAQVD